MIFLACILTVHPAESRGVCKEVACSSWNYHSVKCRIDNPPGKVVYMAVARRESKSQCTFGQSFGYSSDTNFVWVRNGCRAHFQICFNVPSSGMWYDQLHCNKSLLIHLPISVLVWGFSRSRRTSNLTVMSLL